MEVPENEGSSLEQRFPDLDKLNDPSAIYDILEYYEEVVSGDDEFIEEIIKKLRLMEVDWIRPWYQQLDRRILKSSIEDRPCEPEQYRKDRFTKEEDLVLRKNWKKFRKEYKLADKPESFARWRNMDKNKKRSCVYEQMRAVVTAHLAKGLQRTLQQVYRHFVTEYAYPKKGPYSQLEEKIMEICFEHSRKKSVMILSKVLGRESRGIYNRFGIAVKGKGEAPQKVKWNLEMITKFTYSLQEHCGCSLEELVDKQIERKYWLKMQDDLGVPYDSLKKFWYRKLHVQIFLENSISTMQVKKLAYKILKKSPYMRWKDIRWTEVTKRFPAGCTPTFVHRIVSRFVSRISSCYLQLPLQELLEIWKEKKYMIKNSRLKLVRFDPEGIAQFHDDSDLKLKMETSF